MNDKTQLIKLVRDFIKHADDLLEKKQIDADTYFNITKNKVDFLRKVENNHYLDTNKVYPTEYNDNLNIY